MEKIAPELIAHLKSLSEGEVDDFRIHALFSVLRPHLMDGTVLDAGCGSGFVSVRLAEKGHVVTSVDSSEEIVEVARSFNSKRFPNIRWKVSSVSDLSHWTETFDNVVCLDVLEHIEEDKAALKTLGSRVRKGGRLILSVPAYRSLYGAHDLRLGHFRRYERKELIEKVSQEFLIRNIFYWNMLGVPIRWFENTFKREIVKSFRYSKKSKVRELLTSVLKVYFSFIENRVRPPFGLSLIVIAER